MKKIVPFHKASSFSPAAVDSPKNLSPPADTPCLRDLLLTQAKQRPGTVAIEAPKRTSLLFDRLFHQIEYTRQQLRTFGIGRQDRIVLVLPNGPEMAVALMGVLAGAVCAPLNPSYTEEEFDLYFSDLRPGALLVQKGMVSPAIRVAMARDIPVIELIPDRAAEAGIYHLSSNAIAQPSEDGPPRPEEVALLLHTSGTTSRPKLVPLTQSNLTASAVNIGESLELGPDDRCLNMMPLFHVHGMIGALLSSMGRGASVICTPGFLVTDFWGWLTDFAPTWYTAVPAMHRSILARAHARRSAIEDCRLRFIRSCSAPLSPTVIIKLEETFGVPLIEAYGMTETSHQICCNPIPPRMRKPGSVGMPTGTELAIFDPAANRLPPGQVGEIAVRGASVTSGYENNDEANERDFTRGWFRTGDQGYLDSEGYLFLTGRLKEIINRGGEKVSPRQVDDVLMTHPAIDQAVTFALPDERLGEEVAAAVVLKRGAIASEEDIRFYAAEKLLYSKTPKHILFVEEIPKGPTGKIRRLDLAERLGMVGEQPTQKETERNRYKPLTRLERELTDLMKEVLGHKELGVEDNFFLASGDSIQAARLLARIRVVYGLDIPLIAFMLHPTARHLANFLTGNTIPGPSSLVPIKPGGNYPPFFCVHPHDGHVSLYYNLAKGLHPGQPFYAFQALERHELTPGPKKIQGMADQYLKEMMALRPEGPYFIGGYCLGALIAFEMAQRLISQGHKVALLALMDAYPPGFPEPLPGRTAFQDSVYLSLDRLRRFNSFLSYLLQLKPKERIDHLSTLVRWQFKRIHSLSDSKKPISHAPCSLPGRERDSDWDYRPLPYPGQVVLFRPAKEPIGFKQEVCMGWKHFVSGELKVETIPGYHRTLIFKPKVHFLAERLDKTLRESGELA